MASALFIKRASKQAKRNYIPCSVLQAVMQTLDAKLNIIVTEHVLIPKPVAEMSLRLGDAEIAAFSATIHADDGSLAMTMGELKAPTLLMCRAELTPFMTNVNAKLNDCEDEAQMKLLRAISSTASHYTGPEVAKRLRLQERLPPTDIGVILKTVVPLAKMTKLAEANSPKGKFISRHQVMVGTKAISDTLIASYPPFITKEKKDHEKIAAARMKLSDVIINIIAFHADYPECVEGARLATYFMRRLS